MEKYNGNISSSANFSAKYNGASFPKKPSPPGFQAWQFASLLLRKQQRNGLNGTVKSLNCFLT